RVEDADLVRTVAHVDVLRVAGQAPALALVVEAALQRERLRVEQEADVRLPRQVDDGVADGRRAFAEVFVGQVLLLHDLTGLQVDLAQRRAALLAGGLVQLAIPEEQALREGLRVVRIRVLDEEAVHGNGRLGGTGGGDRSGGDNEGSKDFHGTPRFKAGRPRRHAW